MTVTLHEITIERTYDTLYAEIYLEKYSPLFYLRICIDGKTVKTGSYFTMKNAKQALKRYLREG